MDDRCSNGGTMGKKFQEPGQYFRGTTYVAVYISFLIKHILNIFFVETFTIIRVAIKKLRHEQVFPDDK